MKLSERIICQELTSHFQIPLPISTKTVLNLGRPYIYDPSHEPLKNHVVICRERLPESWEYGADDDYFILLLTHTDKKAEYISGKVLNIPDYIDIWELFNFIQSVFDRYDNWDESLREIVQQEEPLSALLDASFPIFENPLLLRASDYFLLAYSSVIEERTELSHLTDPNLNFENLTTCKLDPLFSQAQYYQEPFFFPEYFTGSRELCVNLFEHRIFSYRLILSEELKEIDTANAPLLAHLSEYINLSLSRSGGDNEHAGYSLEHLLREVIDNKLSDYTLLDNRFSEYGWLSSHDYCCLNLKTASLDRQNLTVKYICHYFEEIITGACAFQQNEDIIIFVNLTRFGKSAEDLITSCVEFLRDSFLKAGISNTFHGTYDLHYCCMQSRIALDIGTRHYPYRWIHRFDSLSLIWLLENSTGKMPVHLACSQKILLLKNYDISHKSDYCKTLEVYLKNHLNAVAAARDLYIHRSTFLYRLERIKELAGIDFEDEDQLFYLNLSYRILQLEGTVSLGRFELHR